MNLVTALAQLVDEAERALEGHLLDHMRWWKFVGKGRWKRCGMGREGLTRAAGELESGETLHVGLEVPTHPDRAVKEHVVHIKLSRSEDGSGEVSVNETRIPFPKGPLPSVLFAEALNEIRESRPARPSLRERQRPR